jgi:hypothetical protein
VNKRVAVLAANFTILVAVSGINCHCDQLQFESLTCGPGRLGGWEAWGIDRGLAQPFAARLSAKRRGFCIVPLDRTVRQSTILGMGFNRRKLEDQSVKAARETRPSM